jgi:lactoylglutathione lyase
MYEKITTNIMVDSVNETLDFYEAILGFKLALAVSENSGEIVTVRSANAPLGFAILRHDDVELMFQSRASLSRELPELADRPAGGAFTLYIQVTNVAELYESIRNKVATVKDLHTTFYGAREFYVRDGHGCVLTFAGK